MDKNIAALVRNDTRTVHVRFIKPNFADQNGSLELGKSPTFDNHRKYHGQKLSDQTYTYITDLPLEKEDIVAVNAMGTISVAVVDSVDETVDIEPNSTIQYKWVMCKLDVTGFLANLEKNKQITDVVGEAYKARAKMQFRDLLLGNIDGDSQAKLLSLIGEKKAEEPKAGEWVRTDNLS